MPSGVLTRPWKQAAIIKTYALYSPNFVYFSTYDNICTKVSRKRNNKEVVCYHAKELQRAERFNFMNKNEQKLDLKEKKKLNKYLCDCRIKQDYDGTVSTQALSVSANRISLETFDDPSTTYFSSADL